MADKVIGELPLASALTDDSKFVCEDSGVAKQVTGKQIKDLAKEGAMESNVYDPQGKAQDVFAYVDAQISAAIEHIMSEIGGSGGGNTNPDSPAVEIVPWSTGTDEQIAAMVAALDAGTLSVADTGWAVGDERTVHLSAMNATGVGESHAEQTATLVLMDSQHYELAEATAGGNTKDHFVVGLKNSLKETGYMNATDTNAGGWDECARRAWCNNVFREAIPEPLRSCFKQFKAMAAYNSSEGKISVDYFALFGSGEIFESTSNPGEKTGTSQIEWYKTASNRIKKLGDNGSANGWWERSLYPNGSSDFRCVGYDGNSTSNSATTTRGLAPFGCI